MFESLNRGDFLSASLSKLSLFAIAAISLLSAVHSSSDANLSEIQTQSPLPSASQTLEVKIYYETLCPDSKRFIRYQLYNAMIDSKFFNYTDLKFIPYGKVTHWKDPTTGEEYLICQHGTRECELNALHACIVEHNSKMEQLQMIDCLMGGYNVQNCSDVLKINVAAALRCKSTRSISDILKKYGEETKAVNISFVPSIALDGTFDEAAQNSILENFAGVFCKKYKEKYNIKLEKCSE